MKPTDTPDRWITAPTTPQAVTDVKTTIAQNGGGEATPSERAPAELRATQGTNARIGRSYPKGGLINKQYYDRIDTAMAKLEKPTVNDAIEAMLQQSNRDYFKEYPYLNPKGIEEPRFKRGDTKHEIAHLCSRSGHTPQMELTNLAFDMGLGTSAYDLTQSEEYVAQVQSIRRSNITRFTHLQGDYQEQPPTPASQRVWAVQFAAGMYLREKLDAFAKAGLLEQPQDYEKQKAFSEAFRKKDSEPTKAPYAQYDWKAFCSAPYDMIMLSKEEWRAIEGVALGLHEPHHTPYPKRMEAMKQALVSVELFFDKPAFAEKLQTEKILKEQNAKIGNRVDASWDKSR